MFVLNYTAHNDEGNLKVKEFRSGPHPAALLIAKMIMALTRGS